MKKQLWLTAICLLAGITVGLAQGINFEHGSWKEVLAKAKAENKLVFVDVYTSWCGPCKKMAAEVFPLQEVGNRFNQEFINYKIDAEKGEGIQIAKTYKAVAFPTYLFVNGDGKLVYRSGGSMKPELFLQEAGIALREQNDPRPMAIWDKEYADGKREKNFLIGYLKKKEALELPAAEIKEQLFPKLTAADLGNKDIMSCMLNFSMGNNILPKGLLYNYTLKHLDQLDTLLGHGPYSTLEKLRQGIGNYFRGTIIAGKKEQQLSSMIAAITEVKKLMGEEESDGFAAREIKMNYYSGVHDEKKLIIAVLDYMNNGLLKKDVKAIQEQDAVNYQQWKQPFITGEADSAKMENWAIVNQMTARQGIMSYSYQLRTAAELMYYDVKDPQALMQAVAWVKMANDYFPHFSNQAVYAALLAKTGKKEEAIAMMQLAASDPILESNEGIRAMILDNAEKIKADKPLTNLWHL